LLSFAGSNGVWDCKLSADDKTWSCSAAPIPVEQPLDASELNNASVEPQQTNPIQTDANTPAPLEEEAVKPAETEQMVAVECQSENCLQPNETPIAEVVATNPNQTNTDSALSKDTVLFQQMISKLGVNPWGTCKARTVSPASRNQIQQSRLNSSINIESNYAEFSDKDTAQFTGNVVVSRADQTLSAEKVDYQNKLGLLDTTGDTFFQADGVAMHSKHTHLQLNQDTGEFEDIHLSSREITPVEWLNQLS